MLEKIITGTKMLLAAGAVTLMTTSCTPRSELLGDLPSDISFSNPVVVPMASASKGAEKRKFADFTGDGIEDMGEVNDEKFWSQDYKMNIFPGKMTDGGYLTFGASSSTLDLPLKKKFSASATKIDSGDVNGDGYADIIFTSFIEKFRDDGYLADVALNDTQGSLTYVASEVKDISDFSDDYKFNEAVNLSLALMYLSQNNYAMYGVYSSESISDYLMLDWADSNGDGKDDLYVLWKSSRSDLLVTVFPVERVDDDNLTAKVAVEKEPDRKIYFGKPSTAKLDRFMYNRTMSRLDTEDYNGDGVADLCIYHPYGDNLTLSVALGSTGPNGVAFQPQSDVVVADTKMKLWTTLGKYDSFDGNNDGRADVVHIGIHDGEKVLSYNLSEDARE